MKFLNNYLTFIQKVLSIFQLLILTISFGGCGSDDTQIKTKNEQKIKDSIYSLDSSNRANENKRLGDSIINSGLTQYLTKKREEQPHLFNKEKIEEQPHLNKEEKAAEQNMNNAERFMIERLKSSGQFIIHKLITELNGIKIYMFLSAGVGNVFCITGVSETSLEVLASDCGSEKIKLRDWNNLIAAGNCEVIY